MNQGIANSLRRRAALIAAQDKNVDKYRGKYKNLENCVRWVPAYDAMGLRRVDDDGTPLLKMIKTSGTIISLDVQKRVYKQLKKLYMVDPKNIIFTHI